MTKDTTDYDVIIIGAGAAGLAATKYLAQAGQKVICLEAANRIGGRAHTDTEIFGIPFDRGAHWLHNAKANAYKKIGLKLGFDLYKAPARYKTVGADQKNALWNLVDKMEEHLSTLAEDEADISLADALSTFHSDSDLDLTARFMLSISNAFDAKDISLHDMFAYQDGKDWFCKQGFGAIVAAFGAGLPVKLNTAVQAITRTPCGVTVDTPAGSISTTAVIVTVSQGVLASEAIRFDPPLEMDHARAIEGIPMGTYNHNVLHLRPGALPVKPDTWLTYKITEERDGVAQGGGFLCDAGNSGLTYFESSGSFARDLEEAGEADALAYVTDTLAGFFGEDIRKAVIKGHSTAYGRDPMFLGSYSGALPGAADRRKDLRRPHAERVFFAGEATHIKQMATVSGAHKSGRRAAKAVLRALG
ncbi:MAG: flavin monoamine oxidase family protein [Roseovarius sp.]